MKTSISIFFLLMFSISMMAQPKNKQYLQDSIAELIRLSKNKTFSIEEKFAYAERARRISNELGIDSTIIKSNLRISSIYKSLKNFNLYKKINFETLALAQKNRDTLAIAKSNNNLGSYFYRILESDSAYFYYYNAEKAYISLNDKYSAAGALANMAIIQKNEKDYIGSESTSIQAIKYLEPYIDTKLLASSRLSSVFNNLAIISDELEQYDKAIEYYNKAIDFKNKSGKSNSIATLYYLNNLALVYQESGEYNKALEYFNDLLKKNPNLLQDDASFYARILDNKARTKFLLDKTDKDLPALFLKSLTIKDSIDDKGGSMRSNIHLADYYLSRNTLDKAKLFADKAYDLALRYDRYEDQLETLLLLSKIEKGDKALVYTENYIKLNDSLQKEERAIRNKFARIKFDTDKIEAENVQISREREIFLILAIAGLISAFLIYVIISQRAKNKELRFNQEQQKANEEIYNLMLSQQDKIEEGRTHEKKRISEDLHDGILGRLFGTRLSLDSLNLSSDEEAVKNRGQYIDELKSIEQEIRRISHDLNTDFVVGSGYLDIVETLIENQTQAYKLSYKFVHKDEIDWETVSNKTKIHFYRMLQESLQNIYKHANAKHVDISFEARGKQIYLNIADDGDGFIVNKAKKGIGLKNIKSRVDELKGELFINSQKNAGTHISISVPL